MIEKLLLCYTLTIFAATSQDVFNPLDFDYCSTKCKSDLHTACECDTITPREEVLDEMVTFRQDILDAHNFWRNHVASGEASKVFPLVPPASNMLALNYDLELEHVARCLAKRFEGHHDACRRTHNGVYVGQNLAGISAKNLTAAAGLVKFWYNEIRFIEEDTIFDIFTNSKTSRGIIGHFTQLVWSNTNRVGCARVWNPEMLKKAWRFTLICNYARGGNLRPASVYKKGKPCSQCPSGTECVNERFPALCGKIFPLTSDESVEFGKGPAAGKTLNKIMLIVIISVFLFFY